MTLPSPARPRRSRARALGARSPAPCRGPSPWRDRNVDVSLGLGPQPDERSLTVLAALERRLMLRGVRVSRGVPFYALAPVTVTAFTQTQLHACALQVALSSWLRSPVEVATLALLTIEVFRDALASQF